MNTLLISFTLFLSLLFLQSSMAARHRQNTDLILQTCKITPYYDLCISTLKSDSKSLEADVSGLALIIVEALKSKAIVIVDQIKKLKASNPGWPLSECGSMYSAVVKGDIPQAEQALKLGNPKFAETAMIDAGNVASRCEEEFAGLKSPLTELNNAVNYLARDSVPIIRTLL